MLFSGNANPELAAKVAAELSLKLGNADVKKFSDGEINVEILENVRGKDVFIVQSTCAPTNDNLMELLVLVTPLDVHRPFVLPPLSPTLATHDKIVAFAQHVFQLLQKWLPT
jgi:hypothetical protein